MKKLSFCGVCHRISLSILVIGVQFHLLICPVLTLFYLGHGFGSDEFPMNDGPPLCHLLEGGTVPAGGTTSSAAPSGSSVGSCE